LATDDLEKAMRHAELLIVGVPTTAMRSTMNIAKEWIHPWIPVVSLAKGLEQGSLLRMTEVIRSELPGHPVAALTGPNIAREIMAGQAAASVIATEDLAVASAIQAVLTRGVFRIYTNHDVIGCELGGALKNVVAIACGIAQGLGVGDNTRSMVMTRGLAELTRLGVAMGGEAPTFAGLAGMGDLVTTCISPFSRNRSVGEQLGAGRKLDEITAEMNMVAEGLKTAVTAHELALRFGIEMPVHEEIYQVIIGAEDPALAYRGLRKVQPGHESDPG
jgi:glycerol-3-phosphate dehydrogenase (NAD(P)+)